VSSLYELRALYESYHSDHPCFGNGDGGRPSSTFSDPVPAGLIAGHGVFTADRIEPYYLQGNGRLVCNGGEFLFIGYTSDEPRAIGQQYAVDGDRFCAELACSDPTDFPRNGNTEDGLVAGREQHKHRGIYGTV